MLLVSQAAYIDSFQDILKQDSEFLNKIEQDRPASHGLALQIQKLGEQEFDQREVKKAILYFHESQLAESFNQILEQRLQEAGLSEAEAKTFTERVARHTDENMQDALVEVGEKADKLWKWYSAGGKEKLEKSLDIEDYLEQVIKPKPEEKIFDETDITFRDLYVPLQVKELDVKDDTNLDLEAEDIFWIIEFYQSTLSKDLGDKKDIYAEAGIAEYWVVNLKNTQLQVFRDLKNRQYTTELTLTTGTIVPLAFGDVSVQVHRLVGFPKI